MWDIHTQTDSAKVRDWETKIILLEIGKFNKTNNNSKQDCQS